jgi:hypothetical protein
VRAQSSLDGNLLTDMSAFTAAAQRQTHGNVLKRRMWRTKRQIQSASIIC